MSNIKDNDTCLFFVIDFVDFSLLDKFEVLLVSLLEVDQHVPDLGEVGGLAGDGL